jgi:hypothetical protein
MRLPHPPHPTAPAPGKSKLKQLDRFSIKHFAGEVSYTVEGFLEKNNDTLYTDLEVGVCLGAWVPPWPACGAAVAHASLYRALCAPGLGQSQGVMRCARLRRAVCACGCATPPPGRARRH